MRYLVAALVLLSSAASADTLIRHVDGEQVGADGRLQRFGGLLIGADGRVVRTIPAEEVASVEADQILDGLDFNLRPGMIDSHGHVMALGEFAYGLELPETKSMADVISRMKGFAYFNPEKPWLLGHGWSDERWADKRPPKAADFDLIANDRRVIIFRSDGQAVAANTAALASRQRLRILQAEFSLDRQLV